MVSAYIQIELGAAQKIRDNLWVVDKVSQNFICL